VTGVSLHQAERVSTTTGKLTFRTTYLNQCTQFRPLKGKTEDIIQPSSTIALRHVSGKTWCRHRATDREASVGAPGAVIRITGTIFGIDADSTGTTVKLTDGSAVVQAIAARQTVKLAAGQQVFIPRTGTPQTGPAQLDAQDTEGDFFMRFGVIPGALPQLAGFLKVARQPSVVVVAQDGPTAKIAQSKLHAFHPDVLLLSQVTDDPAKIVQEHASKLGVRTVAVAGDFAAVQQALQQIAAGTKLQVVFLSNGS
jgi:hypothetical protein